METSKQVKYQVLLLTVVVFALGTITGGALDRLYLSRSSALNPASHGGKRGPGRMLEQMKTDLNLTDEQSQAIKKTFEESRQRDDFRHMMDQCPGVKEMRTKHNESIRALLNPDQQKRFNEIIAEREKKDKAAPSPTVAP